MSFLNPRRACRTALLAGLLTLQARSVVHAAPRVPVHNDPRLKTPPLAPPAGSASERARLLVQAIRERKPELATPLFFPRAAFRLVKAIGNPDRYYDHLLELYQKDVLELRRGLTNPDQIHLVGFKLSRRLRWTPKGKEANALPYWDAYGFEVLVRDGGKTRALRLRVMITWDDQWYVTHLTRMK
jgi:hypothetical protein